MFNWIKNKKTIEVNFYKLYSRMKGEIYFDEYNKIECVIISVSKDIIKIKKNSQDSITHTFTINPNKKMWLCNKDYIKYIM